MTRVLFRVDCSLGTGFGHLARCLAIGHELRRTADVCGWRGVALSLIFQGAIDAAGREVIQSELPEAGVIEAEETCQADVAVIDRLADPEVPESWDSSLFESVRRAADFVVVVLSGQTDPLAGFDGKDVLRIGYQPDITIADPPGRLWGLEYAPGARVPSDPPQGKTGGALIALGGGASVENVDLCIQALQRTEGVSDIHVLVSPIRLTAFAQIVSDRSAGVFWHTDGAERHALAFASDMVITSFGNFGYEVLSLGRPTCFAAARPFQDRLAATLERMGFAVNAGSFDNLCPGSLANATARTLREKDRANFAAREIDHLYAARIAGHIAQAIFA